MMGLSAFGHTIIGLQTGVKAWGREFSMKKRLRDTIPELLMFRQLYDRIKDIAARLSKPD
jgi:hypothetical protein